MRRYGRNTSSGFTLVELLIVIVVIAILAAITIVAYNGIQKNARNSAMVAGVKQYIKALNLYKTETGRFPTPPSGTNSHDREACFGNNYEDDICMVENDGPDNVNPQPWFNLAMSQVLAHSPDLPSFVYWTSDGDDLYAGAFYIYTHNYWHKYLDDAGLDYADALVVYYLDGNVPDMCNMDGGAAHVYLEGQSTDHDITICYIPLGDYEYY